MPPAQLGPTSIEANISPSQVALSYFEHSCPLRRLPDDEFSVRNAKCKTWNMMEMLF
jgi:hypothetical protein